MQEFFYWIDSYYYPHTGGYFSSYRALKNVIASIYKRKVHLVSVYPSAILRVRVSGGVKLVPRFSLLPVAP